MKRALLFMAAMTLLALAPASHAIAARDAGIAAYKKNEFDVALRELKPDAEAGDVKAQYYLGLLHAHGYGVEKNATIAATWFRKAAEQGNREAQFDLGHLYRRGAGVPQDDKIAVSWWRKAADSGDTFAQSSLAEMYLEGRGVERNLTQAYKWIVLAEPRAQAHRVQWNTFTARRIAKMMKPAQLAKAQKLVKQWLRARR
jgi:TPR repeat protein